MSMSWAARSAGTKDRMEDFSLRVIALIRNIPPGQVSTYGRIAALAGSPRSARQVARLLHSVSEKRNLPWHRVINAAGGISLSGPEGKLQRQLLEAEGVFAGPSGKIDLKRYLQRN